MCKNKLITADNRIKILDNKLELFENDNKWLKSLYEKLTLDKSFENSEKVFNFYRDLKQLGNVGIKDNDNKSSIINTTEYKDM